MLAESSPGRGKKLCERPMLLYTADLQGAGFPGSRAFTKGAGVGEKATWQLQGCDFGSCLSHLPAV